MGLYDTCAATLRSLADDARRLPPPDRRNPHAFHEAREDLAQRMTDLARVISGTAAVRYPPKKPVSEGWITGRSGKAIRASGHGPESFFRLQPNPDPS
jgi:hypothetical protein